MNNIDNYLNKTNLNKIEKEYGEAFYILDLDTFKENFLNLKNEFSKIYSNFNIAYSYKTNYIPKVVEAINDLDGYAEVVSEMELDIALKSKVLPSKIIWNGPVKNENRVNELLLSGGTVNIDNIFEIENIEKLAKEHQDKIFNIGIRCNFDVGDDVISRFGLEPDSEDFDKICKIILNYSNINLIGIQCHFAKRNAEYWKARAEGMIKIYELLTKKYKLFPKHIDLGGGLYGIMPNELRKQLGIKEYSFKDYANQAATCFKEHFKDKDNKPLLLIEPGSALAGNCLKFVCKVKSIKKVHNKYIANVIGSQKNISMNGINPPMRIISNNNTEKSYENIDIAGYTCIESDYIYKNYSGKLGVGDYIVIDNCGSYSIVMKPPFILPNFPVIYIDNFENIEVIKRKEKFEDLFNTYVF